MCLNVIVFNISAYLLKISWLMILHTCSFMQVCWYYVERLGGGGGKWPNVCPVYNEKSCTQPFTNIIFVRAAFFYKMVKINNRYIVCTNWTMNFKQPYLNENSEKLKISQTSIVYITFFKYRT